MHKGIKELKMSSDYFGGSIIQRSNRINIIHKVLICFHMELGWGRHHKNKGAVIR